MTTPNTFKHGIPQDKQALVAAASIIPSSRNPTSADTKNPTAGGNYLIPTVWTNKANGGAWILTANTGNVATWTPITDAARFITTGLAPRKGASAFVAGVSPNIATTAVKADSVICICRTNIAGVTTMGEYVTITPDVGFIVTASETTDTSSFTWAIVA